MQSCDLLETKLHTAGFVIRVDSTRDHIRSVRAPRAADWEARTSGVMDASAADKSKEDELLVFGYACKLFRDNEKALYIDSGKHLIPWMADETLKIDRYDGRGALSDLRPHEPPPGGHDRWHGLTERERRLEELVDRERYLALYQDEDEQRMLEEEEWKRLQSLAGDGARYSQMGYTYDAAGGGGGGAATGAAPPAAREPAAAEPEDEPYQPPAALGLPDGMAQPGSRRHADIIERTAHFVARQGPQMEILIKAKQSDNVMFNFLSFDDPLQPFFRHMVVMIKAGRYTIGPQKPEGEDEAYLHPALNLSRPDIAPGKVDVMYQPSANCAYQLLVKNIRSRQATDSPAGSGTSSAVPPPPADVRLIIDKMASYVAKNGRDFEGIVMGRGDERFSFLKETHKHHAYYRQKLVQYERDLGKTKPPPAAAADTDKANKPVPVSFSIRPKSDKESTPLERSALPLEESEEEADEAGQPAAATAAAAAAPTAAATAATAETNGDVRQERGGASAGPPAVASRGDGSKRQTRQVPLVAPAPGVGRDEIQLDRKRRAAQFLAKLRQDVDKHKQPIIGPQLPPGPLPAHSD
ncbi:protein suppressor of white apricot-like, partial [Pollicipes pollicipes]|uniref:protein suppressor of white apricot-like n=1 Tax=Pollicipes pollicipes TaxID=41117 RepID=UPI001885933E